MGARSGSLVNMILIVLLVSAGSSYAIDRANILGAWLFDGEGDNIAEDSSGNDRNGEILGNVERMDGQFGKALSFPGQNDSLVTIPHDDGLNVGTFSITAWIKAGISGQQFQVIVTKGSEATTYGYYLILYSSPPQYNIAGFTPAPQDWKEAFGTTDVRDDQWHHMAGTYDKKSVKIYRDGELEGELAVASDPDTVDTPLAIGAQHDGFWPIIGIIDDVALFDVGLTENEVKDIMEKGVAEATGVLSVSSAGKLATAWGKIKTK
ncbi:LamG domain-containing protein [Candidatus Poribacteria bacterium]